MKVYHITYGGRVSDGMKGCPALSSLQLRGALHHLKGRYRWRDRALLTLGVRTGLRISELLSLQVGHVWNEDAVRSRVYLPRRFSKSKRAGNSIVIHEEAAAALAKWLEIRGTENREDWLFNSQRNYSRPLGRRWASRILHRAFIAAGRRRNGRYPLHEKDVCWKSSSGAKRRLVQTIQGNAPYVSFDNLEVFELPTRRDRPSDS